MAYTGFLINLGHSSVCAPDSVAAVDALGAAFPVVSGSPPYLSLLYSSSFTAPNVFSLNIIVHDLTGVNQWQLSHNVYLARCDPATYQVGNNAGYFADGVQMGWGVVAAMAAALGVIFLKNALFTR